MSLVCHGRRGLKLASSAETEWEYFLANVRILDSWLLRGLFQMFGAVLTLELSRSTAPGQSDFHKSLRLYRVVAGVSLLVCSGLYILGGILCWGRHKAKGEYLSPSGQVIDDELRF